MTLVIRYLKVGQRVDLLDEGARQSKKGWVQILAVGRLAASAPLVSGRLTTAGELVMTPYWK